MNRKIRTMTAVVGVLLVSTTAAYAQPESPDPGVRCAAKIGPGEYDFYLPGAKVTDKDGKKWVCGPDGQWFRDYSSIRVFRFPVHQVLASATLASATLR